MKIPTLLLGLLLASPQVARPPDPPAPAEEVILPACMKPAPRTDEAGEARQRQVLDRVRDAKASVPVVFIGDSITQGWEGAGAASWREHFEPFGTLNLGVGGDRTEHVLWRLEQAPLADLHPQVVVLMIGTNNASTGRDSGTLIARGVHAIVDKVVAQCPATEVLVLDIPPRGQVINPLRGLVLQVNQALAAGPWPDRVTFLRVADGFVRGDGTIDEAIMPDFLHLSAEGYRQWAAAIAPAVRERLVLTEPRPMEPVQPEAAPNPPATAPPPAGR
jgi:lysophospholipase L1-like esterase